MLMMGRGESTLHVGEMFFKFPNVAMGILLPHFSQTGRVGILKALCADSL